MELVSVVVLAYKSAATIIQTLDSIKNQTYQKIELVITDDCSTDNTVEVAQRWIDANQGALYAIKLVTSKQNTGIPGSLNRALGEVRGTYMKVIAADDYLAADAIAEYMNFCRENPKAIPIAKLHLFSDEKADFKDVQGYCDRCYEFAKKDYKEQYRMLLIQNRIAAPSGSFYPVEAVRNVGGYDERFKWFEDYPMNLKIMHGGYRCGLIDKELVYYRISGGSITASRQAQLKKTEMKLFFKIKMPYMVRAGLGWEAVKQLRSWIKVAFSINCL